MVLGGVNVVLDMVGGDFEQLILRSCRGWTNCLHRADAWRSGHNRPDTATYEAGNFDRKHLTSPDTREKRDVSVKLTSSSCLSSRAAKCAPMDKAFELKDVPKHRHTCLRVLTLKLLLLP